MILLGMPATILGSHDNTYKDDNAGDYNNSIQKLGQAIPRQCDTLRSNDTAQSFIGFSLTRRGCT